MGDSSVNRKIMVALVMVFTMILMPWSAVMEGPELEINSEPRWANASSTASQDTMLNSSAQSTTHGSDANLNLSSISSDAETRLLFSFPLTVSPANVPVAGSIQSASMTLYTTSGMGMGDLRVYVAGLNGVYDEGNATWLNRTHNTTWEEPGAAGDSDHDPWEPLTPIWTSSASVTINITSLAQETLATQSSHIDVIVSMTGTGLFTFASSEHPTTSKRPSLSVTYSVNAPLPGAAISLGTPTNGSVSISSSSLLLSSDVTPIFTWTGHNGTGVELQVSRSADFRSENDSADWHADSWGGIGGQTGFSLNGTNGNFTMSLAGTFLDQGMIGNWRARSTQSSQLSDWEYGHFLVPEHNITNNGNSTVTLEMFRDSHNMSRGTVHDTVLFEGSPNMAGGDSEHLWIGNSNNTSRKDMHAVVKVDIPDSGIHTNATVLSAYLNMRRTDRQGDPWISIYQMNLDNWSEGDATWDDYDGTNTWESHPDYPADKLLWRALDVQNGNKSGPTFKFDVTYAVQEYLREAHSNGYQGSEGLSFILLGGKSANEWVRFASSEDGAWTYRPTVEITYEWGDGQDNASIPSVISPLDKQGVWNIVNGYNITADLTPTLNWSASGNQNDDVRIEFANDIWFSEGPLYRVDSRDANSGISTSAGTFTVPTSWDVDYGEDYYWRLRFIEDGDWGEYTQQGFVTSTTNSTWVSNNTWEIRLRHNNASSTMTLPNCGDTYIDSLGPGSSNDGGELSITSSQYTLFGCDIRSHILPPGLAVTDAELQMKTSFVTGSVSASVYELINHLWMEDTATWENYDGVNNWSGLGASGSDRGQLLDSTTISSTSSWVSWNVTVAVQNSMRWSVPADFLIVGSGSGQAAMYDKENGGTSEYPELVIRYSPGSMEVPDPPNPVTLINGDWAVTSGMLIAPEKRPTLSWNHTGTISANGWVVEMDTTSTFNSNDYSIARSWSEINDFDVINRTYVPATNLSTGDIWYWRARGSSLTNQLGNWSSTADFVVPNIESGSIDSDNSYIVIRPGDAVPTQSIPSVPDTWVTAGANRNDTHSTASNLVVGCSLYGCLETAMLSFPLGELPQPSNSRIVGAELSLWPYVVNTSTLSSLGPRISVHQTLRNWTHAATGVSWNGDGSNNSTTRWMMEGGWGYDDIGPMADIGTPVSSSWFRLNVTEIVHSALADGEDRVNMSLVGDWMANFNYIGAEATFYSSDYTWSSSRPYLTVWYRNGTGSSSTTAPWPLTPAQNDTTWDLSGHALGTERQPTLSWNHSTPSSVDNWRVVMYNDSSNERDGYTVHDSRMDTGFDIVNMTWDPSSQFDLDAQQRWFVQSVKDDMLGPRSSIYSFDIPNEIGTEINSTDARLRAQEGSAISRLSTPQAFADATIDEYSQNSNYGNNGLLSIGRSPSTFNSNYESHTVMRINISSLPVPQPWEIISADVEMYCSGCGTSSSSTLEVGVFPLLYDFVESEVNWNRRAINTTWSEPSVGGQIANQDVTGNGWYGWDITQLVQQARFRGDDTVMLAFIGESSTSTVLKQFYSSEHASDWTLRPVLNITHRIGTQWLPEDVTNHIPLSGSTLWQPGEPRPSGMDPVVLEWSHPSPSNVTAWHIELSTDHYFSGGDTHLLDSSDSATYAGTFDTTVLSYEIDPNSMDLQHIGFTSGWPDAWIHWRVRALVGDYTGNWTLGGEFRVPDDQGSDDGLGNHTVTMYRGSVFEDSGVLPSVPDTWVDSTPGAGTNTSQGDNETLVVGASPFQAGQESVALVEFDLGELPFPSTMLATTVSLQMYRVGYSQNGNPTVSVHECSSFAESDTWSTFSLSTNCNSSASSSVSLAAGGFGGVWYNWDVTTIVQSAGYNGTVSIAVKSNWSGYLQFSSSENPTSQFRPHLVVGYIDNQNGTTQPATPILTFPQDQQVLYEVDQYDDFLLESPVRPTLAWLHDSTTTGYILTLFNGSTSNTMFSWNTSAMLGNFSNSAVTATFTPGWDMAVGEGYYWNVQSINGSVLGPRSSTWSFAIGDPDTSLIGNSIWKARFQEGADAEVFNHPQVEDTYISEGDQYSTHGSDEIEIGSGCDGGFTNQNNCTGIFQIDLSQVPLTSDGRVYSANLELWIIDTWSPISSYVDITAYALLNGNFSEHEATWHQASLGNTWNASGGGLMAGVDRGVIALDTVRVTSSSTGWVSFDVSGALGAAINGTFSVVLIGTPQQPPQGIAQFVVTFDNSESTTLSQRPRLDLFYTSVIDISISGPSVTNADTPAQFNATLSDANSNPVVGSVEWSTSDGSISTSGLFTPDSNGTVYITARFGRVMVSHTIIVQPGTPVTLIGGPLASIITSDESVSLWVDVLDANGNSVPGEMVYFTPSNGSMAEGSLHVTPVGSLTYMPWTMGNQWVNVTWGNLSLNLQVTVTEGIPVLLVMTSHPQIPAGETRDFNWTAYDMHDNVITPFRLGTVNWTAENGTISSTGEYSAYGVGFWNVTLSTAAGLNITHLVETTHGAIDELELTGSATSLTADEELLFWTVRIDVMGNRLNMTLPLEAWAWSNGSLFAEDPVRWTPWVSSYEWVEATLEGLTTRAEISVFHGEPVGISIRTQGDTTLASGNSATVNAYAYDQHGNEWVATIDSWEIVEPMAVNDWLSGQIAYAEFDAVIVGDWTVKATYMHEGTLALSDEIVFTVTSGPLSSIVITGHGSQLTADDSVNLNPVTRDLNQNLLSTDMLRWFAWDATSPTQQPPSCYDWGNELTNDLQNNGHVWQAGVEGTWRICASSGAYQTIIEVTVTHGVAAVVYGEVSGNSVIAGLVLNIQISATDSDGNSFDVDVSWSGSPATDFSHRGDVGAYSWDGKLAGNHSLIYTHNDTGLQGVWNVSVTPSVLGSFELSVLPSTTVRQQDTITVNVKAFDAYGNEIPVPEEAYLDKGNDKHLEDKVTNSQWTIYMLAEGSTTITVVTGNVYDSETIIVEQTLMGFFEEGGALYYVGAGLGMLILLGVIVVLMVLLRRAGSDDDEEYDDDYYEDEGQYDEYEQPAEESYDEPSVDEAGYGAVEAHDEESATEGADGSITTDEDGTEWWEDDEGVWWYRYPDMEDWAIFEE